MSYIVHSEEDHTNGCTENCVRKLYFEEQVLLDAGNVLVAGRIGDENELRWDIACMFLHWMAQVQPDEDWADNLNFRSERRGFAFRGHRLGAHSFDWGNSAAGEFVAF